MPKNKQEKKLHFGGLFIDSINRPIHCRTAKKKLEQKEKGERAVKCESI